MLDTMSASLWPENDAVASSQVVGTPARVMASDSTRLEIGSESTRTPSQSKITSESNCSLSWERPSNLVGPAVAEGSPFIIREWKERTKGAIQSNRRQQ